MKKKKKLRKGRLIAVVVILCLLVGLVAWGGVVLTQKIAYERLQEELHTKASDTLASYNAKIDEINAVSKPDDVEQETFDTLKSQAISSLDVTELTAMAAQEELDEDTLNNLISSMDSAQNSQAIYFMENISLYPEDQLEYYLKDTDRFEFVKAYPNREEYQTAPETLEESLDSVPHLLQWDLRWGYEPYGNSTVAVAGCAPTCLSMVFSYLNQDPTLTPAVIKTWSDDNGYYVIGAGTAHSLLSDAAANWGVNVYGLPVSSDGVISALQNGQILILNMVPGQFTSVGHFIVADSYDESTGMIHILDPNSNARTKEWNIDEVLAETAAIWAYYK